MIEQIAEALGRRPFAPFTVRLVSGEAIEVTHPEAAHIFRTRPPVVAVMRRDGRAVSMLNATLILGVDITPDDASGAA